jgi:hypothetical protein
VQDEHNITLDFIDPEQLQFKHRKTDLGINHLNKLLLPSGYKECIMGIDGEELIDVSLISNQTKAILGPGNLVGEVSMIHRGENDAGS